MIPTLQQATPPTMLDMHPEMDKALETLKNQGIILFPTDTIWGLGCDATNSSAVEKIIEIKKNQPGTGCVVLVDSMQMLKGYIRNLHPRIETLLLFHTRPVTIVYDDPCGIAPEACIKMAVWQSVLPGILLRELIQKLGKPIVAAAAAVEGEPLPAYFGAVRSDVIMGVDHVVRYRQKDRPIGEASVIMKMNEESELDVIRE
ncbi:MAG: Sua5/YciO/YrdC/YwlC family protein [Saprospiraceae bacterium]